LVIPERLSASCRENPDASDWLTRLPAIVRALGERWSFGVGSPVDNDETSCAWVAPATRADGSTAILKVSLPHFEAEHEIAGLRFWDGDPTVRLLDADEDLGAMLLERCEPGTHLRALRSEVEQDAVIASALVRLWRHPQNPHPFRPLSVMIDRWREETLAQSAHWRDAGLVRHGLDVLRELSRPAFDDVLLATDLHAGNVLCAQREEWLVIDPKPFVGDRAYDATQHLLNCPERLASHPIETVQRFASLLGVSAERVQLWLFARAAAEPRADWNDERLTRLARALAP
jgi:streptomycin 6-kinase